MTSRNLVAGTHYHHVDVNLVVEDHVVGAAAVDVVLMDVKYFHAAVEYYWYYNKREDEVEELEKVEVAAATSSVATVAAAAFACAFGSAVTTKPPDPIEQTV